MRGTAGGRAQPAGSLNTIGGASALEANPNNIGGARNSGGITAPAAPGTGLSVQQQSVQMNSLPAGVQTTLGGFSADGALGSVTAVPGQAGTFRATVTQNGRPMEITVGPNGQILSRTPITGSQSTAANPAANVQAGIPLTSLPPGLQNSIQSQLNGAQVQSISRDDLANGSVLRVTALQNGVPTEMRFGANGQLLSATPLGGTATSPFVATGAAIPGSAVVMDALPTAIQEAVRAQLSGAEANRIMQQRTATGVNYMVSYDQNGRPMTMIVGPDGRIISNGPANVGAAGATATGTATADRTTNATRDVSMTLDELPDTVENVLKQTAPYAEVRTVTREQRVSGDVYVVAVREGDRAGEITVDADGRIIEDTRRDLSALTARPAPTGAEKPAGMPYESLPVAIQNAVKAYAAASDIRAITLGLDTDGRTVFDVVFYRDGRRDRMIIRKDGTLVRIEENVSPATEYASAKASVIAIGDLPPEVQGTIRRQTDTVVVDEIGTKEVGNQTVYSVRWKTNGAPMELLVSKDGHVIEREAPAESESADKPIAAPLDPKEPAVVKVVDDSPENIGSTQSAGAAASNERGVSVNLEDNSTAPAPSAVKLSDAPEPVQNTAKKIAGSGTINSISPKLEDSGMVYEVRYLENGQSRTVQIDRTGKVLPQNTDSQP